MSLPNTGSLRVEKAGQVIGPGMGVAQAGRNPRPDLPLVTDRRGESAGIHEILVEHENSRLEGCPGGVGSNSPYAGGAPRIGVSALFRKML